MDIRRLSEKRWKTPEKPTEMDISDANRFNNPATTL
jgi:hypothetical protein